MKKRLLFSLFLLVSCLTFAQPYKTIKPYAPYKWMVGVHWTVIEDDGNQLGDLFNVGGSWNYLYYPTRITVDRYLRYGWSLEASASYMTYLAGKRVNDTISGGSIFFCGDVNAKYSLYNLYAPRARWIEPYFTFGLGYTFRSSAAVAPSIPTLNLGLGFNIWFHKNVGLQLHTNGKLGLWPGFWDSGLHTNYFQHSAGIVVRWSGGKNSNGDFGKKQHKWTRENNRYKKKGGH